MCNAKNTPKNSLTLNDTVKNDTITLHQKLNLETGKISWQELQRHFARGVVINVSDQLDLINVAVEFSNDNSTQVKQWSTHKQVSRADDEDAKQWLERNAFFWAVVVNPWVLVQEIK